jgi:hypothetical protein
MDLTQENQAKIDSYGVEQLLARVRFAPIGDPWMQGETGAYWLVRLREKRNEDLNAFVDASKSIGWVREGVHPAMYFSNN